MTRTTYVGMAAALLVAAGLEYLLWQKPVDENALSAADASGAAAVVQAGTVPPPPPGVEIVVDPSGVPVTAKVIAADTVPIPDGYVEYRNTAYRFSFYHAPEATVKVYDEGGGATTVTVENFAKMRGFQVFVVPYAESTISDARFREDVPSGVRQNVEATTLDSIPAVTFNSEDATLGATREIWVLHGGYLYEITTFSGVGQWFAPIIESWQFT